MIFGGLIIFSISPSWEMEFERLGSNEHGRGCAQDFHEMASFIYGVGGFVPFVLTEYIGELRNGTWSFPY